MSSASITASALAPYLPIDRRLALAANTDLPVRGQGAVLFADISGFVKLTVALVEAHGPRQGAEMITAQINAVFEILMAYVHRYGGAAVCFSGDAITCWFGGDDGLRATAAALYMRDALKTREPLVVAGVAYALRVKSAVTAGAAQRFAAGDPAIQLIDVLVGDAVDRNAIGANALQADEVMVGPEVAQALGTKITVAGQRTAGNIKFSLIEILNENVPAAAWTETDYEGQQARLEPWLLPPVRERLLAGKGAFLAELRPVSSLFLRFSGLDFNAAAEAPRKFDKFLAAAQNVVKHYDGWIVQLSTGDKGTNLCATFGVPVAHGNDPERAVAAAFKLRELQTRFDFVSGIHIGLGHGPTWVGAYGATTRMTFGVHGRQVNLAARLMQKAEPGQILIGGDMADSVRRGVRLQDCGNLQLKGETVPIPVHQADERIRASLRRAAMRSRSTLVGRDAERALLLDKLRRFCAGAHGDIVILAGEPGIGKSKLLEFLLEMADLQGVRTAFAAADAVEQSTPYYVWRTVLEELAGINLASGSDALRAWVLERLRSVPDLLPFAGLLNDVLPLDLEVSEQVTILTSEGRRDKLRMLLVRLVTSTCEDQPVLLVLEDAHWLDTATWALLTSIIIAKPRMLLVLATRPLTEPVPPEYRHIAGLPQTTTRTIESLTIEQTMQLVCDRLGVDGLPDPVRRLIADKAQGHPFFSEELAYALRDRGAVEIRGRSLRLLGGEQSLAELRMPDTVEEVVHSRIDQLSDDQQFTLKVASVIGRVFPYRLLCDVYPAPGKAAEIKQHLEALAKLDITQIETPEPELSYFFKHIITQEVAYSRLTQEQRAPIHKTIALSYEAQHSATLSSYYTLLVHHWRAAGDVARCMHYLEKSAEYSDVQGAFRESADCYTELIETNERRKLVSDPVAIAHWCIELAKAQQSFGDPWVSLKWLYMVLARLGRPSLEQNWRAFLVLLREVLVQILHRNLPAALWRRRTADAPRLMVAARAYERIAEVVYYRNDSLRALAAGFSMINVAEQAGDSPELVIAAGSSEIQTAFMPLRRAAEAYQRLAMDVEARIVHMPRYATAEAYWRFFDGMVRGGWGELDQAARLLEESLKMRQRIGEQRAATSSLAIWTAVETLRGNLAGAARLIVEHDQLANQIAGGAKSLTWHQVWVHLARAQNALLRGELRQAAAELEQLKDAGPEHRENFQFKVWHGAINAQYCLDLGRFDEAASYARPVLKELKPVRANAFYLLEGYAIGAEVQLRRWEQTGSAGEPAELALGVRMLRTFAKIFPVGTPRCLLMEGRHLRLRGDAAKAERRLKTALAEAERMKMPYEQGLALLALAQCHTSGSKERLDYATRARKLFEAMDARSAARRAIELAS